jgi:hypothetical protein
MTTACTSVPLKLYVLHTVLKYLASNIGEYIKVAKIIILLVLKFIVRRLQVLGRCTLAKTLHQLTSLIKKKQLIF